jgi:hypothetical protein
MEVKVAPYPAVLYMQTLWFFTSMAKRSARQRLLEELCSIQFSAERTYAQKLLEI